MRQSSQSRKHCLFHLVEEIIGSLSNPLIVMQAFDLRFGRLEEIHDFLFLGLESFYDTVHIIVVNLGSSSHVSSFQVGLMNKFPPAR
jgi:hypothetical protein